MRHRGGGDQQEKQKKTVDADHHHIHMDLQALPEGCIADVVSLTTPPDECRFSAVSRSFLSAAESDAVWDKFLPHDIPSIISHSSSSTTSTSSKKELYLTLCENPILVDDGKMSFFLDKWSGKKCFMISARDLMIAWGDTPYYWIWNSLANSRFEEVAQLRCICWLEIYGKIETRILSPSTVYQAYLVFMLSATADGFHHDDPLEVTVGLFGEEKAPSTRTVFLAQKKVGRRRRKKTPFGATETQYPKKRIDGWLEVEMGEFFCPGEEDGRIVEMTCVELDRIKSGLIVQGIEVRPKRMQKVSHGAFSIT